MVKKKKDSLTINVPPDQSCVLQTSPRCFKIFEKRQFHCVILWKNLTLYNKLFSSFYFRPSVKIKFDFVSPPDWKTNVIKQLCVGFFYFKKKSCMFKSLCHYW